jgi:hypothetical protein
MRVISGIVDGRNGNNMSQIRPCMMGTYLDQSSQLLVQDDGAELCRHVYGMAMEMVHIGGGICGGVREQDSAFIFVLGNKECTHDPDVGSCR